MRLVLLVLQHLEHVIAGKTELIERSTHGQGAGSPEACADDFQIHVFPLPGIRCYRVAIPATSGSSRATASDDMREFAPALVGGKSASPSSNAATQEQWRYHKEIGQAHV